MHYKLITNAASACVFKKTDQFRVCIYHIHFKQMVRKIHKMVNKHMHTCECVNRYVDI